MAGEGRGGVPRICTRYLPSGGQARGMRGGEWILTYFYDALIDAMNNCHLGEWMYCTLQLLEGVFAMQGETRVILLTCFTLSKR